MRRLAFLLACLLLLPAAGCGKKGPPLPPIPRLARPGAALEVRQIGNVLEVMVPLPAMRLDGTPLTVFTGARIDRIVRPAPAASRLGAADFLHLDEPHLVPAEASLSPGGTFSFTELPPAGALEEGSAMVVAYSARFRVAGRGWSEPSPPAVLQPGPPPAPPTGTEVLSEPRGVSLTWEPAATSTAIYRAAPGEEFPFHPMIVVPPGENRYIDAAVAVGARVSYQLRALAGDGAVRRQSEPGPRLDVVMRDTFAPPPPQGLTALSRPGGVDLFWISGETAGLGGYRVYRRVETGQEWELLTPAPLRATTWSDGDVQPGLRYAYAVTAVDSAIPANESLRSSERVVTIPAPGEEAP